MKLRTITIRAAAWITVFALAACSAGGNSVVTTAASGALPASHDTHPAWWRQAPASARAGVYVTQANGSSDGFVFGFKAQDKSNDAPLCTIGNQSFTQTEIGADASGNVYVPNVATGSVNVYAPNCGSLIGSFSDPFDSLSDVTVHGNTIYAAGGNHVAVCTKSGCPTALTDPSILQLETAAVDSKGNVWASYYSQTNRPSLIVWPGGSMPGHVVTGYANQNTPGGLAFDRRDALVSVQTLFAHVYTYRCNASKAACINTGVFALQGGSLFGAFNAKNTNFQVTDYAHGSVDVYGYPSFAYQYSYNQGFMPNYSVVGIVQTH
jgi:hypothetical protein